MSTSVAQLLFGLAGFAAAYAVARALSKWLRRRASQRTEQAALKNQSRQVRRANERARKQP
jgi:small-conductance mechanosensitive channel